MVRVVRTKATEDVSYAVEVNSNPIFFAVALFVSTPMLLLSYFPAMPLSSWAAGATGSFLTALLVMIRPINLFGYWKHHGQFTPAERKAVSYLRSPSARNKVWRTALLISLIPLAGALYGLLERDPELPSDLEFWTLLPLKDALFGWLQIHGFTILNAGFSFAVFYYPVMSKDLRRRWKWIQQHHQPADREYIKRKYQRLYDRYFGPNSG